MDAKRKAELEKENQEIDATLKGIDRRFVEAIQQDATKHIRAVYDKYKRTYNSPHQMPSNQCIREVWGAIKADLKDKEAE